MTGPLSELTVATWAIRYCISRRTYAFNDGLALAEHHWRDLDDTTRRDVMDAIRSLPGFTERTLDGLPSIRHSMERTR